MTSTLEWRPYDPQSTSDETSLRMSLERDHSIHSLVTSPPPPVELCSVSLALDQPSLLAALGDYIRDGIEPTGDVTLFPHSSSSTRVSALNTSGRNSLVTPEQLARRW